MIFNYERLNQITRTSRTFAHSYLPETVNLYILLHPSKAKCYHILQDLTYLMEGQSPNKKRSARFVTRTSAYSQQHLERHP